MPHFLWNSSMSRNLVSLKTCQEINELWLKESWMLIYCNTLSWTPRTGAKRWKTQLKEPEGTMAANTGQKRFVYYCCCCLPWRQQSQRHRLLCLPCPLARTLWELEELILEKVVTKRTSLHRSKIFRFLTLSSRRGGKRHIKNLFLSACYFPHTAPLAEIPLTPLNWRTTFACPGVHC